MNLQVELGDITADVIFKDIKHVHLSVYPPTGRVRIAAPHRMQIETIRIFALSKLGWIKQQQKKFQQQARESPREYIERESHYVWGQRYLLTILELDQPPAVELGPNQMYLVVRPNTPPEKREAIISAWYREQLKTAVPPIIARWEPVLNVKVQRFYVQRMKTKWGSSTPTMRSIRLNTELAKKPPHCLEYIVVHEMAHLLEASHNRHFIRVMDQHMPHWRHYRDELNQLPVRQEQWQE